MRLEDPEGIGGERSDEEPQTDARAPLEPAGVDRLLGGQRAHSQTPRPLRIARSPATNSTITTRRRTTLAETLRSTRTPTRAPSITPMMDGATSIGSTAPRFRLIHA